MKTQNGSCRYRDELGLLWEAKSYVDENGTVTTEATQICETTGTPCTGLDGLPADCPVRDGQPCPAGLVAPE